MLKQLRKRKTAKRILWTLAIIIIPPFIFWGAGGLIREKKGKVNYAGKIFGRKIGFSEYNNSFLAVKTQMLMQLGENAERLEKYLNLPQQAWDRLILLYESDKRRIKIEDSKIINTIGKMPIFQKNNSFDQKIYDYAMRYVLKTSARAFEENLRDSLRISKLYEELTEGINISGQEIEAEYKKENEEIKVEYLLISPTDYAGEIKIKDEEIKEYFDKEKSSFLRPASVNIEYLGIDYSANEQDKDKIKEKLQQLKTNIKNPDDFARIAKEQSLSIRETGFFLQDGFIPGIGDSVEINKLCFGLSLDEISPPLEAPNGVYILRLKSKKEAYLPETNEVRDLIINALRDKKCYLMAQDKATEILTQLKDGYAKKPKGTFPIIAKDLGLKIKESPLFKRNSPIEGIGVSEEFAASAFNLTQGIPEVADASAISNVNNNINDIIEINKNFYIILGIKEFIGIDKEKFAKERQDVTDKLLSQKKEEAFMKFMQELKGKAKLVNFISQDYNPNLYR
ncbi:MAG: SurA N-terminal domain-containing protein [Candidatus Omnitrophota bacterium]|nr:SurA N-terminal domain-containing protein [Candidatus Omnitrophota bacterium]